MEQTDIFERIYKPLNNLETDNYLFETDIDLTLIDENKIWTLIEGDKGLFITAGYHFVNRLNYIITERPRTSLEEEALEFYYEESFTREEVIDIVFKFSKSETDLRFDKNDEGILKLIKEYV